MLGRTRRKQLAQLQAVTATPPQPDCALCGRPIPSADREAHHLVPRSQGGRVTLDLHHICHRQIHALFSEVELARRFHTIDALLQHPDIRRFVSWVRNRPAGFRGPVARRRGRSG